MLNQLPFAADAVQPLPLYVHVRAEPEGQTQTVYFLGNPLLHLGGGGHAGRDDLSGKGFLANLHCQLVNGAVAGKLLLRPCFNPAHRQRVGATQLIAILWVERLIQLIIHRLGKPVAHRIDGRTVDSDALWLDLSDILCQHFQLVPG